jgi:acyl-CoA reductase-like NAD-dependent aldehyde dehydrogenase
VGIHVRCWLAASGGCLHHTVEPTVLTSTPDMKVVHEEIFGPVLVAAPFTDLDEIAAAASYSESGLGAGSGPGYLQGARAGQKAARAGAVWINCYNVFDAALPFGGYKAVRLGPRDPEQLHRGQGRHHSAVKTAAATGPGMAGPSPAACSGMATSGRQAR